MPTAPELLKAFPGITGIRTATVKAAYRTLREDGLIPKCEGSIHAEVDSSHAALLLLGSIADVPAHNAAKAAALYYSLRNIEGLLAGDEIARMLDSFGRASSAPAPAFHSRNAHIIVDLENPRVVIVREAARDEAVFGVKAPKSSENSVSTSKRISGHVLFELSALFNKNAWAERQS